MNNAIFSLQPPANEPVLNYAKNSPERAAIEKEIKRLSSVVTEIPLIIDGKEVFTAETGTVVMPHDHSHVIARYHMASAKEAELAIESALEGKRKMDEYFMG